MKPQLQKRTLGQTTKKAVAKKGVSDNPNSRKQGYVGRIKLIFDRKKGL